MSNYPLWLQAFQKKQLDKFRSRGLPTRKEEAWKYTDVSVLADVVSTCHASESWHPATLKTLDVSWSLPQHVSSWGWHDNDEVTKLIFIDGQFSKEHSDELPKEIIFSPLSESITQHENIIKEYLLKEYELQRYPFAVLNSGCMNGGVFLQIPKNVCVTKPLHFIFYNRNASQVHLRNLILVEDNAEVNITEEYISGSSKHFTNTLTKLVANKNAKINWYKVQDEDITSIHMGHVFVEQKQDSCVNLFNLSKGSLLSREEIHVRQQESGSECHMSGMYKLSYDKQHIDNHLHIDHQGEHGVSSMLYKGILDKNSHAVFNGKVYVHPNAQHINAHQANHNILLSKSAEVSTKPELEIYADNVKCAHGATVGQLDAEALFYFRSRGINSEEATKLLLAAFADEVIGKIQHAEIKKYIQKRVEDHVEL